MRIKIIFSAFLLFSLFALTGCLGVSTKIQDTSKIDGGVFRSANKGSTWQQKVAIPTTSGKPLSFSGVNMTVLTLDPSDNKAIYAGTIGNGLFVSYDGAENWQVLKNFGLTTVNAVQVDPKEKCTIFAAKLNTLYKSEDCNRTWERVYYDNDTKALVTSIAIDQYNTNNVYIGISRGDLIKSLDGGESWQTIKRFKNKIRKIVIDPNDSRIVYATTQKLGVFQSLNNGSTWTDFNTVLNDALKKNKLQQDIKDIELVKSNASIIYVATFYGLLMSNDKGTSWEKIELIPPEKKAAINALAINPQNAKEIYYVTNTAFYSSNDGGENWKPSKLPTTRAGKVIVVDPVEPDVLYLGVASYRR